MKKRTNFFTDENALRTIDTFRIVYLVTAVFWFLLTEAGRNIYRPFIYANKIDDYGIADSIGNSGGIIVQIFFMLAILNSPRKKVFRIIGFVVVGYILYEIVQPYLPRGVFDWKDIYGTLVGGVIALLYFLFINNIIKNNKVLYRFKK
ncbi:MAG: hypothetical protein KAJ28_09035 [Flavobacteriaceae bacterium]|nr:hypothetical protein [Flavobacteriaceae bacterium]